MLTPLMTAITPTSQIICLILNSFRVSLEKNLTPILGSITLVVSRNMLANITPSLPYKLSITGIPINPPLLISKPYLAIFLLSNDISLKGIIFITKYRIISTIIPDKIITPISYARFGENDNIQEQNIFIGSINFVTSIEII